MKNQVILLNIIVLSLLFTINNTLNAQHQKMQSSNVLNDIYIFMNEFEDAFNTTLSSTVNDSCKFTLAPYFYNTQVSTISFFSETDDYTSVSSFFEQTDSLKSTLDLQKKKLTILCYNLELTDIKSLKFFDLIELKLLLRINTDTIKMFNGIPKRDKLKTHKKQLKVTLVYRKFINTNQISEKFNILNIETQKNESNNSLYYKPLIPFSFRLQIGNGYSNILPNSQETLNINSSAKSGWSSKFQIEYALKRKGGDNISMQFGIGFSMYNSKFKLDSLLYTYKDTDQDGMEYTRNTSLKGITQDISMTYLDFPIGIHFQHSISKLHSVFAGAGVNISTLIEKRFTQGKEGIANYSGQYIIEGYPVEIRDLPEYGFDTYSTHTGQEEFKLENLLISTNINAGYNYRLNQRLNLFCGLQYTHSLTNPLNNNNSEIQNLSPSYGNINPLVNYSSGITFQKLSVVVGVKYTIKNNRISIPFGKLKKQNRKTNDEIENYFANEIGLETFYNYEASQPDTNQKISLRIHRTNGCSSNSIKTKWPKIPYVLRSYYRTDNEFGYIKSKGKQSFRIKSTSSLDIANHDQKGLYLLKPFGYNIYPDNKPSTNDISKKTVFLNNSDQNKSFGYSICPLPDFNLFILSAKSRDGLSFYHKYELVNIVTKLINQKRENGEECYVFFQGPNIDSIDGCQICNPTRLQNLLNTEISVTASNENWDNELRSILSNYLIPSRRKVKIHILYTSNYRIDDLLDRKLPVLLSNMVNQYQINYYLNFENLIQNKDINHFFNKGEKSIHLYNSKIFDINKF